LLKEHEFLREYSESSGIEKELINLFEKLSRGYFNIDFNLLPPHPAIKQIIISGSSGTNDGTYNIKNVEYVGTDTVIEVYESLNSSILPLGNISYKKVVGPIIKMDTTNKEIHIKDKNLTLELTSGDHIKVYDTNGNDGDYTVNTVIFTGVNTVIKVNEPILTIIDYVIGRISYERQLSIGSISIIDNKITASNLNLVNELKVNKIILTGFDPFQLHPRNIINGAGPETQNPSGIVALALSNKTILVGTEPVAYVQTTLFPVRYPDFDEKVVENVVEPFLSGNSVDFIISTSLNGSYSYFDLERYAAKIRSTTTPDNLDIKLGHSKFIQIQTAETGNEFYETTLPSEKIITNNVTHNFQLFYQRRFFDQSFKSSGRYQKSPPDGGPNVNSNDFTITPNSTESSEYGSGGTYLSNEVFYRIARCRENHSSSVKTGHYHIANPKYLGFGGFFTNDKIIIEIIDMIKRAITD